MSKKDRFLLLTLVIATVISVSYTFYQTIVKQNFEVVNVAPIDSATDSQ